MSRAHYITLTAIAFVAFTGFHNSASAEPVTLADLQGAVINVVIDYDVMGQKNGHRYSGRSRDERTIVIGPGDTEHDTDVTIWFGQQGPRISAPRLGSSTFGQAQEVRGLGGGARVVTFADGKLVLMRTFKMGGYKTEIKFARGAHGLTCTARAPIMHENGAESIRQNSAFGGGEIEVLRQTQISSSCRITMRN